MNSLAACDCQLLPAAPVSAYRLRRNSSSNVGRAGVTGAEGAEACGQSRPAEFLDGSQMRVMGGRREAGLMQGMSVGEGLGRPGGQKRQCHWDPNRPRGKTKRVKTR